MYNVSASKSLNFSCCAGMSRWSSCERCSAANTSGWGLGVGGLATGGSVLTGGGATGGQLGNAGFAVGDVGTGENPFHSCSYGNSETGVRALPSSPAPSATVAAILENSPAEGGAAEGGVVADAGGAGSAFTALWISPFEDSQLFLKPRCVWSRCACLYRVVKAFFCSRLSSRIMACSYCCVAFALAEGLDGSGSASSSSSSDWDAPPAETATCVFVVPYTSLTAIRWASCVLDVLDSYGMSSSSATSRKSSSSSSDTGNAGGFCSTLPSGLATALGGAVALGGSPTNMDMAAKRTLCLGDGYLWLHVVTLYSSLRRLLERVQNELLGEFMALCQLIINTPELFQVGVRQVGVGNGVV